MLNYDDDDVPASACDGNDDDHNDGDDLPCLCAQRKLFLKKLLLPLRFHATADSQECCQNVYRERGACDESAIFMVEHFIPQLGKFHLTTKIKFDRICFWMAQDEVFIYQV